MSSSQYNSEYNSVFFRSMKNLKKLQRLDVGNNEIETLVSLDFRPYVVYIVFIIAL